MGGERFFWTIFGGTFVVVGLLCAATALYVLPMRAGPPFETPLVFLALIGLGLAGGGSFAISRALRDRSREKRVMESGVPVLATVTALKQSSVVINNQIRWSICYRYDYGGRTLTGKSHPLPFERMRDVRRGQAVRLKVDPRRPQDSLFIGPA